MKPAPMGDLTIDNAQARQLVLHLQGLTRPHHLRMDDDALLDLIAQLGFVQMDSIQWVERAHHMILQARSQTYRPGQLKRLHEKRRDLFEHWTHDASLIPSQFYCYWQHKFARDRDKLEHKFDNWQGPGFRDRCGDLVNRIERDGALMSRQVERADTGPMAMWQWHDGKAALEFLWRTGQLCIARREGFQKVYDLVERGVNEECRTRTVSHDAFVDWACRSAIHRLGFATPSDMARFWDLISIAEARDWCDDQMASTASNTLLPVTVQGARKRDEKPRLARRDISSLLNTMPDLPKRMRVLSPFDPVIRDRNRLSWLWGFDYRIEIYVPEAKRQWGYYVFPLLEGERLVGRIDMRANRKANTLEVKRVWWEKAKPPSRARMERLSSELVRQARFAGVQDVVWLDGAQG